MPCRILTRDAYQIHGNGIPNQNTEGEHDPRQIGRIEIQNTQKAHFDILVATAPHIHHHKGQGTAKKVDINITCHQSHVYNSKEQKVYVVCCSPSKIPFFEQAAVSDLVTRKSKNNLQNKEILIKKIILK